ESSKNVLIKNNNFNNGDDNIAIKSGKNANGRRINVFARNINTPTVSIFSRFYCNVVITIIKVVIFNENIFAGFWIHSISIRSMPFYGCTLNGYVFREDWMNVPHWRIIYSYSFN